MKLTHPLLYLFVLLGSLFVFAVSSGEMVWGASDEAGRHWTEKMFYGICHQLPDRTYGSADGMMAVNTRCFGIFAGNATGWILIPFLAKFTVGKRWPILLLSIAVTLQAADVAGNIIGIWENTNHSRAFIGSILGLAVPVSVSDLFFKRKPTSKLKSYGR